MTFRYLGADGQVAVPILIREMQSDSPIVSSGAVDALYGIASRPDLTIPALTNCPIFKNAYQRQVAVETLCRFPAEKGQTIPTLLLCTRDTDPNVWLASASGLERILDADEKKDLLIPALIQSLTNANEYNREGAANMLKRIDPLAAAKAGVK